MPRQMETNISAGFCKICLLGVHGRDPCRHPETVVGAGECGSLVFRGSLNLQDLAGWEGALQGGL